MYNWNTDTTRLKKNTPKYDKFVLEQQINFGLNNTKISLEKLKKHWDQLDIDKTKRNYLKKIVWNQS
ncbi:MAG: hypothetical protein AUJ41_01685 [Candidatus Pacebacteria bacterium CG1_02_43_31]|uniref:Uncharacterized protein n=1 Tax=Candidatus Nomurabacteria bacterium CG22_combo_CG10-13_8_21_14_all_32_8 TaxID=1974732 RepID=A0A2H0CFH1_9BACT|nr:MAG: hypothetical protein AUJ41_01685 [Candidatus Pacebacteria bacterium CG1_02_43_31]PIP68685.1 MAG: hypothetical protein COW91_03455 [Candidatus Nomurabacteria bacterium CG22_combo_CG10-13_8_21_14_all_32_8]